MPTDRHELEQIADLAAEKAVDASKGRFVTMDQAEAIADRAAMKAVTGALPDAVEVAVVKTLTKLGFDAENPRELVKDQIFVRDMRMLSADSRKQIVLAVLLTIVGGICAAVWTYLKATGKG